MDAPAQRRQQLLLQPADRQHAAAQRHLAGHRDIAAHRHAGQCRDDRGGDADTRRRTILGHCAFGQVDVDILAREQAWAHAIGW